VKVPSYTWKSMVLSRAAGLGIPNSISVKEAPAEIAPKLIIEMVGTGPLLQRHRIAGPGAARPVTWQGRLNPSVKRVLEKAGWPLLV
jgi:hypothetical protein